MSRLFGFAKGYERAKKLGMEEDSEPINNLYKEALIREAGYDINRPKFGQPTLTQTEQFGQVPEGYVKFGRKLMPDKSVAYQQEVYANKPPVRMNELQQEQLGKLRREESAAAIAEQEKEENLRQAAEENIRTIEEAKKGSKYFGPMGDLPSIVAPSSLFGEYGSRKKWESNVDKLLSQKVIDVMTAMKQASKTGATGFGPLSNRELGVLQQASTALKRGLMPEDALMYLNEIEKIHKKFLGGRQKFGQVQEQQVEPVSNTDDPLGVL